MHNESQADRTPEPKESKIKKFAKKAAITTGAVALYATPVAIVGVSAFYGLRTQKLQYEVAKLALEAAKK